MKTIMIVDGQGGGIGKALIEKLKKAKLPVSLLAIGTNSIATGVMLKAGANDAATGENAIVFNAEGADFIVGAIGIISANAMLGEISPKMAAAIASAPAKKYLVPLNKCNLYVAGASDLPLAEKIDELVAQIQAEIVSN